MIKLAGITVLDTEAGLDLCKLVYEQVTGECYHDEHLTRCPKCGEYEGFQIDPDGSPSNPALLTSLDAWRPLWDAMREGIFAHVESLFNLRTHQTGKRNKQGYFELISGELILLATSEPIHHLETAAMCLEAECGECGGSGYMAPWAGDDSAECPHCKDGKTTVLDKWTRKWEESKL